MAHPRVTISDRVRNLPRVGSKPLEDDLAELKERGGKPLALRGYPMPLLPEHITEAAARACRENRTAPSYGLPELRAAIAEKLRAENGIHADPDRNVLVTAGGMHALHVVMQTLLNPGDEVAMFSPNYFFAGLVELSGGVATYAKLDQSDGFAFQAERLADRITPRTKLLLVSSPANPTGYVATRRDLEGIAEVAKRHDLLVVSDESYERFVYDDARHLSLASLDGMAGRTITVQTFTKCFAMPGWRLGYVVADARWLEPMRNVLEWTALSCSYVAQRAARAALEGPRQWFAKVVRECQRNRDIIVDALDGIDGVHVVRPKGTVFIFPRFDCVDDVPAFSKLLLNEYGIPNVDGAACGAPGFLRIPFAGDEDAAHEAARRLREAVRGVREGEAPARLSSPKSAEPRSAAR